MNTHSPPNRKRPVASGRRGQERTEHRQAMLAAAERVFVRKGFREATVFEIAREADFAVGTFYNFFESKDDLYVQVLDGIVREFMAEFAQDVQERDDPAEALSALIDLRMRVFDQHRDFFRLLFEQSAGGLKLTPKHLKFREQYQTAISEIFVRGVRRGVFDAVDPLYAAIGLNGMLNGFVRYWSAYEGGKPSAGQLQKMKKLVLSRFCRHAR